ncbi:ArsR/SmtB family transcription factor [Hydromonas duriensis]|uniref:ArsR family transcriptional regulator n=1 Tax=Hydromonas duriensis TaxID=1527608 RepID=A0A4R6Y9C7_9BURK|nr:metalloregulator ArsR/SmtB family transcription factor [Hydromonas duriensis]TDR32047.1 ArsR family transcriptional regulator [Hydromonas duriensis]
MNFTHSEHIVQLADLFDLLGDQTRLQVVLTCLAEPIAVTDIAKKLNVSTSLISHHLRLLRAARVVNGERQGKHILCSVNDPHIRTMIINMLEHIAEPHDD